MDVCVQTSRSAPVPIPDDEHESSDEQQADGHGAPKNRQKSQRESGSGSPVGEHESTKASEQDHGEHAKDDHDRCQQALFPVHHARASLVIYFCLPLIHSKRRWLAMSNEKSRDEQRGSEEIKGIHDQG
jgi:hypothetical protein